MSHVESIFITAEMGAPLRAVEQVRAIADSGLEGDRYASIEPQSEDGPGGKPEHATLIEAEAIEAVSRDCGIELQPHETRRNIVTRGVALNHLVGREFTVGAARLRGVELCEPCAHLEKLTRKGVCAALIHRGGLRCAIVAGGEIRVGDVVTVG